MHKILEQLDKKIISNKSKELRIQEKAYFLSTRLCETLNRAEEETR